MHIPILYYIIPETLIKGIYTVEEILCILLIVLLITVSLFEIRNTYVKLLFTVFGFVTIIVHYYAVWYMTKFESIILYPMIIVESTTRGSSISIDYGQLILIGILIVWRKNIISFLVKNLKKQFS